MEFRIGQRQNMRLFHVLRAPHSGNCEGVNSYNVGIWNLVAATGSHPQHIDILPYFHRCVHKNSINFYDRL